VADHPPIHVAPDVASIVALGVLVVEGVTVRERDPALDEPLAAAETLIRTGGVPETDLSATRAMYRRFGIDPTKVRPSSEALLRRIRKGEPLPRINTLVDVCNWCSAEFQLSYGLYDFDRIDGAIELRRGRAEEEYPGIRKEVVHAAGRPVLTDRLGPFGNPTSDSARTMVTASTARGLVVVYAPLELATRKLPPVLDVTAARITTFAGGREVARHIVVGKGP
jgi:DNA/RNA-binding domain of Phe-tRNA-synthetase-like protein